MPRFSVASLWFDKTVSGCKSFTEAVFALEEAEKKRGVREVSSCQWREEHPVQDSIRTNETKLRNWVIDFQFMLSEGECHGVLVKKRPKVWRFFGYARRD